MELASRVAPAGRALRDAANTLVDHRRVVLATLMVAQVGFVVALALSIEHNGWLYYQGGDQIWLVTTGWLFTLVEMPWAIISPGWPLVLAPITALTGPDLVAAIPPTMALNVLVLGPLATWAVYALAARIAGARACGVPRCGWSRRTLRSHSSSIATTSATSSSSSRRRSA